MNSDFSDFIRFFPIFRLFPTSRLLDSTPLGRIYLCGGHGQEGGDPQGDPGRNRLVVDPEGEPRDEDDHGGRHVDCQDEEGQLPWF